MRKIYRSLVSFVLVLTLLVGSIVFVSARIPDADSPLATYITRKSAEITVGTLSADVSGKIVGTSKNN